MANAFGPYSAELVRVIDGDTVKVRAEIWPGLFKVINVRLDGINTPESRNGKINGVKIPACEIALGKEATALAKDYLQGPIIISNIKLGKYAGRVLGNISTSDGPLADALMAAGLAKPYHGGGRSIWDC